MHNPTHSPLKILTQVKDTKLSPAIKIILGPKRPSLVEVVQKVEVKVDRASGRTW